MLAVYMLTVIVGLLIHVELKEIFKNYHYYYLGFNYNSLNSLFFDTKESMYHF